MDVVIRQLNISLKTFLIPHYSEFECSHSLTITKPPPTPQRKTAQCLI